jgi:presenilin 1
LGDFIFYSVLLARAAMLDTWPTIVTCFLALLTVSLAMLYSGFDVVSFIELNSVIQGLCFTLFCLAWFQKPLPALPISIALGIIFYFATSAIADPFLKHLLEKQIFI